MLFNPIYKTLSFHLLTKRKASLIPRKKEMKGKVLSETKTFQIVGNEKIALKEIRIISRAEVKTERKRKGIKTVTKIEKVLDVI